MIRRAIFACATLGPLGACLLDLPEPRVDDDAGFDGSAKDTGVSMDGMPPMDGMSGMDGGSDGMMMGTDSGACDAGPCVFTTTSLTPRLLDNANGVLYFAVGTGEIDAMDIGTKKLTVVLQQNNADFVRDLKVRNGYVYFTSSGMTKYNVSRCAISGCSPRFDFITSGAYTFWGVDADAMHVYFTIDDTVMNKGGVWGCLNTTTCSGVGQGLPIANAHGLAADSAYLNFHLSMGSGAAYACAEPNCPALGTPTPGGVRAITTDGTSTWYVDGAGVFSFPKGTPSSWSQLVSSGSGAKDGIAVRSDGTNVYWLTKDAQNNGALRTCKITQMDCMNGPATTLVGNIQDPVDLTVTSTEVFYSTVVGNTIWRVAK